MGLQDARRVRQPEITYPSHRYVFSCLTLCSMLMHLLRFVSCRILSLNLFSVFGAILMRVFRSQVKENPQKFSFPGMGNCTLLRVDFRFEPFPTNFRFPLPARLLSYSLRKMLHSLA